MEQTANTMPAAALGQYKGLAFTRRVRPVSEKAVEADIANLARVHAPFVPTGDPAARGCAHPGQPDGKGDRGAGHRAADARR